MADSNVVEMKREVSPITTVLLAEYERREFVAFVPHGVVLSDVLKPGYWAHVAERFVPFRTYIDVIAEDSSWIARLVVTASDRNWAQMHKIYYHDLDEKEAPKPTEEFEVNFCPAHQWRIVRVSDKEVIQKDFTSKDAANKELKAYINLIKG